MKFDLQLFAEDAIEHQTPNQLRNIAEHFAKIDNPEKFCDEWSQYDDEHREGLLWHWQHEILTFERSIQNRIDELAKRGELP